MSSEGLTSKIFQSLVKTLGERSISLLNNFRKWECYMLAKKGVGNTLLNNYAEKRAKILTSQSYSGNPIF